MKRSEKNDFVAKLKDEFENSSSIIVTHYSNLSVKETDEIRKAMRENATKFKVTKNRLTKLALANTKYETITDLFSGPTAIAYSSDPIAPAKVAVEFGKKFNNLKILGGYFEGEKISEEKIKFLASLLSVEETRGKLVGLLLVPAQKVASILQTPASQLTRLLDSQSKELEKAN